MAKGSDICGYLMGFATTTLVIPGRREAASPESILPIVVMDSGLVLRTPPDAQLRIGE